MASGVIVHIIVWAVALIVAIALIVIGIVLKHDLWSCVVVTMAMCIPVMAGVFVTIDTEEYSPTEYNIDQMALDYNAKKIDANNIQRYEQPLLTYYKSTDEWVYYTVYVEPQAQYKLEG